MNHFRATLPTDQPPPSDRAIPAPTILCVQTLSEQPAIVAKYEALGGCVMTLSGAFSWKLWLFLLETIRVHHTIFQNPFLFTSNTNDRQEEGLTPLLESALHEITRSIDALKHRMNSPMMTGEDPLEDQILREVHHLKHVTRQTKTGRFAMFSVITPPTDRNGVAAGQKIALPNATAHFAKVGLPSPRPEPSIPV
ncbi:MAG: hypothetical protein Q7R81_03630 [Candidatus Peregrinibacteria bacterium]|nr:hypothetical protein [Candidatus Peregrinibacteria bacterium]